MGLKKGVLVYLVKGRKVCLGMKKIGYSKGKWNGFGGKVELGGSDEETVAREVEEEAGVKVKPGSLILRADFYYHEQPENWTMKVFVCKEWKGEIKESEEMKPEWFDINSLPLQGMWENDAFWVSKVLTGTEIIRGTFWHDEEGRVIKHEFEN